MLKYWCSNRHMSFWLSPVRKMLPHYLHTVLPPCMVRRQRHWRRRGQSTCRCLGNEHSARIHLSPYAHLDTHTIIFLHTREHARLSVRSRCTVCFCSPQCLFPKQMHIFRRQANVNNLTPSGWYIGGMSVHPNVNGSTNSVNSVIPESSRRSWHFGGIVMVQTEFIAQKPQFFEMRSPYNS